MDRRKNGNPETQRHNFHLLCAGSLNVFRSVSICPNIGTSIFEEAADGLDIVEPGIRDWPADDCITDGNGYPPGPWPEYGIE